MPTKSPFKIELTSEEEQYFQNLLRRRTTVYRDVERAKIILLASEGLDNNEIGSKLCLARKTVSKWRQRFYYERLEGLKERARSGRPCVFSP